jgi:Mrp family chromosome partitioning ATPase/predicted Fe-Mo cluster-binding NifX family protein
MANCTHQQDNGSCAGCDSQHEHDHEHGSEAPIEDNEIRAALLPIRHKLLVMSGKGGVGKSSVAVSLAVTLARRGFAVGLIDVDLHGPNVLRMLGLREPLNLEDGQFGLPGELYDHLKVISIEALMKNREAAIIWRGPVKHKIIQQFLTEINWGALDFLIIDAPPGTGDEPLTVAHTIPEAQAIIVTTPQEISLADVRKSINFCVKVNMKILGLVENMSSLICPDCGKEIPLFKSGGGARLSQATSIPLLGSLPFDHKLVEAADAGELSILKPEDSPYLREFNKVADAVLNSVGQTEPFKPIPVREPGVIKVAMPVRDGKLSEKFGALEEYALITVKDHAIVGQEMLLPPPQQMSVLPNWLESLGVTHIIVRELGETAKKLFKRKDIEVIAGAPIDSTEELIRQFIAG